MLNPENVLNAIWSQACHICASISDHETYTLCLVVIDMGDVAKPANSGSGPFHLFWRMKK
jgi:hypothetical protein